ncbi:ubiquitin carboxyl-terminal hydrolase 8-like [Babylonia areolata]|uniref:ubiquitin carboxyl-terminal hydrolase 8-like n=1 Tax=Babylonia areolata TaxID=304850 RepID=UPI003FD595F2
MPSKEKKRELYLAGSMAELQKKSEVKAQTSNARILIKSADVMFREAEKHDLQGDEEKAFIMYMRYFNVVKQIKATAEYKKNKSYYDDLLGRKNQVRAIEQAEKLAESLKERYEFKEAEAVAQKFAALEVSGKRKEKEVEQESEKPADNKKNSAALDEEDSKTRPSTSANNSEAAKPVIVPTALCSLLRDGSTQLIIMDARGAADFSESHINHAFCISVPQEVLAPGTTVTSIESQLPPESLSQWKQRGKVDHIVLLDWSSKLDSLAIGDPLRTLKDALFVYDSTVIIKSEPLVLEGGYEQWLLFYPTMTTNSRVARPNVSTVSSSVGLLDFDYPEFEEPQTSKPEMVVDQTATAATANSHQQQQQTWDETNASVRTAAANASAVPQFNRALKPRAPTTGGVGMGMGVGMADAIIGKTSELNNMRNVNVISRSEGVASEGGGVAKLSNHLYPSFVVASGGKKGEKNTNIAAEESRAAATATATNKRRTPDDTPTPPPPPPAPSPALSTTSLEAQEKEEAAARAKLRGLEEKRKAEEKALADIMRQKRHMEEDLKAMQRLATEERQVKEAHEKTVKEEEAERKRQAEVERLRQERKKKELEAQKEKDRLDILAKEKELQDARVEREEEEERRLLAQQQAEKLRQETAEKARQELEKQEQAKLEAEKQAQLKQAAVRKAEEEKRRMEEEEKKKKEEEERARKEEEERRKRKEKEDAEERERRAEEERRSQEKENQGDAIRQAQEPKMIPSPSLPAGWEKRLDNSTRRYYYIDHNRGKTQWEPPTMTTQPQHRKDTYTTRLKDEPTTTTTRGGLSRSHSSPDIMKQLADEAKMSSKPVYDRGSKPSISSPAPEATSAKQPMRQLARRRDLNPVYGNVGPAMTGLRNLGNTCYMNSTVQCLNNTTPLVSYLLNDSYLNDINRDSSQGMHGEVVDEFAVVVKALWSGQNRCITPRDLKNTVGKYNPMFAGYQQQDSQEFLTFLLDGLHEGLNEVKQRPQIPDQDNDRLPDAKAADLAWEHHKRLHRSIIVELFQGQLKSTLMCRTCHKKSVTFQAFMYISLPIPASHKCSLRDCFRAFLQPEMMTGSCKWKCPQCKVERDAEKKIDIWKLPHILLIGLNRFVSDGMWMQKKTTYVDFPINDLDLQEVTLGPKRRSRYNLYGVSNHYGTMEGGHYTAFCRNPCNGKWHKFDDQEVYDMSQSEVKTSAAFVLYYTSIPLNAPQFKRQL